MKTFNLGTISKKLALLVFIAVLPALAIILYSGIEQRRHSIENARRDLTLLTQSMADIQYDIARSARQILSTLALLPEVQNQDENAARKIFQAVLKENPDYRNITIVDLDGRVLVSGLPTKATNLSDRKHIREARENKNFAAGEYIVTRVGTSKPAFAFAHPVLDAQGNLKALLTMTINLSRFEFFHSLSALPEKSFLAITDHQGIRLFYHPSKEDTNPVGQPIRPSSWEIASKAPKAGIFRGKGSDGKYRLFAFEQVRLIEGDTPYLYVWAGIPEAQILATANIILARNLLLILMAAGIALLVSWLIGKNTLIQPIKGLVSLTEKFAAGNLAARNSLADSVDEFGALTEAFHSMAASLAKNQAALQENEARFRLVMDSLDALVYVADMDSYEILFINQHGKKIFGDITGKICWQSLQVGQTGPCPFCTNQQLLDAAGQPAEIYTWEFQNTQTGHWYYIQDRAITWVDGRIVRLEIATDISERKQAETRLAEERERLAVTLKCIGDGVITTDTQGRIVLLNQVAEELTGWSNERASGRPLAEVFHTIHQSTREVCENPVEKILASEQITGLSSQTVLIAKNGQERVIADSGAPIKDKAGKVIGVVLVFRDTTEQQRTEQELIKAKKLESVGVLAGGIAHDFNNILAAMLGYVELALRDKELSEKTRRRLGEVTKASQRAQALTQQLLTFAKGGEPIKETASLGEVIKDSADFVLRGDVVACRYKIPADLWLVDIDKNQISQVVQNIILNASHAMPGGGTIEVSCENIEAAELVNVAWPQKGNAVKVTIKDTGIGIPENLLEKIFDPYFSTKKQGSGLGLAISHSIISKHDGYISVQSTPGAGTTFNLYLPAAKQNATQQQPPPRIEAEASKGRILIMDDEAQIRNICQEILSELGHEVLLAEDGEEAVRIYQRELAGGRPVDLIIMDLTVPGGMGGKEAAEKIFALVPSAKIVVSSGYSQDPIMSNFSDHGFSAALAKPYQFKELAGTVGRLMRYGP